jgi:two-component SAPR family response regulator
LTDAAKDLMMRTAVLIDNDVAGLQTLERALHIADPSLVCMSLVFADEAVAVIEQNLKTCPDFIFLNVDVQRNSGIHYLTQLRNIRSLNDSKIIIFSSMLPPPVIDLFKLNGADFVFQTPRTNSSCLDIAKVTLR